MADSEHEQQQHRSGRQRAGDVSREQPAATPGRTSNTHRLSAAASDPVHELSRSVDEVRRQLPILDEANRRRDPHASRAAASTVKAGLRTAREVRDRAPQATDAEAPALHATVDELAAEAEPLLAAAFQPSPAAITESRRGAGARFVALVGAGPMQDTAQRPRWDQEVAAWQGARSA
ncbi:MAG: hypothetical protein M3680_35840, partial [Myxococcota bacterium]|nr:hypothetical protein [Myxococcota bacterium]